LTIGSARREERHHRLTVSVMLFEIRIAISTVAITLLAVGFGVVGAGHDIRAAARITRI
jgi:hypothetical protein